MAVSRARSPSHHPVLHGSQWYHKMCKNEENMKHDKISPTRINDSDTDTMTGNREADLNARPWQKR